ncbi:MAG: hypothetical protein ACI4IV_04910, partial [Acutalibacteraceae bacterium]
MPRKNWYNNCRAVIILLRRAFDGADCSSLRDNRSQMRDYTITLSLLWYNNCRAVIILLRRAFDGADCSSLRDNRSQMRDYTITLSLLWYNR